MPDIPESTIPISVEVSESLSQLLKLKGGFERRLATHLNALLKQWGLSGESVVTLNTVSSQRAVRFRIHGKLQPFDPGLSKRVWSTVATPALRDVPEATSDTSNFPDEWLTSFVANAANSKTDLGVVSEYLTRLVIETLSTRPACLLGPAQARDYAKRAGIDFTPPDEAGVLATLLKSLLDLGISAANHEVVRQSIAEGQQLHHSTDDIAESIFTQLRSSTIGIHVHPDYLNKCLNPILTDDDKTGTLSAVRKFIGSVISSLSQSTENTNSFPVYSERIDNRIQSLFRNAESELFNQLGVQLPEITLVPSSQIPDGFVAIKINDCLSTPILGLQAGESLAHTTVEELAKSKVSARPARMVTGDYSIVNDSDLNTIAQLGFTTSDSAEVIAMILRDEARKWAARLIGVEDLEYQLAQLRLYFPALVRSATACFSLEDLTRVMRSLVSEGISIRNARAILEGMLKFDTITVPSQDLISFDERLELQAGRSAESNNWRNVATFVRTTLKDFIAFSSGPYQGSMNVFTVELDVQNRAERADVSGHQIDDSWLTEVEQEALRDSVWNRIAATHARNPILTTTNARVPIQDLLRDEIPDIPVIAYSELAPTVRIFLQGTIGLETTAPLTADLAAETTP